MAEQNTEITLGTGLLLGLFFGLVAACAVFFLMGYSLGRSSAVSSSSLTGNGIGTAVDASGKPGAVQAVQAAKPDCATNPDACPDAAAAATSATAENSAAAGTPPPDANSQPDIKSPGAPPEVARPVLPAGYIIQVAAVSKQQDAEALADALRKKQYAVFVATPTGDTLFHVQIGPFADPKDAESIRSRLIADGYNPILKK